MLLGLLEVGVEHLGRDSEPREHLHAKVPEIVMAPKGSAHQDQQRGVYRSHDDDGTDSVGPRSILQASLQSKAMTDCRTNL